jgi:hypothetical protein
MIPAGLVTNIGISAVIAAASFGIGINMGVKYERATWEHRMAEVVAEQQKMLLKHQEEIEAERLKQRQNEYKVEKEKESAIKQLKHDYERRAGSRLYVSADCPKATGQTTASSSSVVDAGTTAEVELPQQVRDDLYREAARADELVESFRALQHWILYNGLYKAESSN